MNRVSDLRVLQAQRFGIIVGLPKALALEVAVIADILPHARRPDDLVCMFADSLVQVAGRTWMVRINPIWGVMFDWDPRFGAVDIHLNVPANERRG